MAVKLPPALLPNTSVSSLVSAECRAILREEPDLSPSSQGAARAWALQPGQRSSPAPPLPAGAKMAPGQVHHLSLPLLLPVAALLLSLLLTGSFALCKCQDAGQLRRCSRRPRRFNLYIWYMEIPAGERRTQSWKCGWKLLSSHSNTAAACFLTFFGRF